MLSCSFMRFFSENGQPRLDRGRLQLGGQAPFKPRDQPMLEIGDLGRRAVAGKNNLFVSIEQGVESVKEFFLRTFFAPEKLDVVDAEQIRLAVPLSEFD